MKKFFTGLFLLLAGFMAHAQTADEIIGKYETAAGGRQKLEEVRYLEVFSNVKLSVMGRDMEIPVTLVRERGKLFRRQVGGIMGMGDSFTMITDTSGVIYIPPMRGFGRGGPGGFDGGSDGNEPSITPMSKEEVVSQQYELDCAGAFGELVNYAAKGHKAELAGTEKVNKVPCYKIKLTLKTGQVVYYYIDTQSYLVKKIEASGDMAMNLTGFGPMMRAFGSRVAKDPKATVIIKEYKEVKGVQYPSKYQLSFGPLETEVENQTIQINEGLEEKWYHVK